MAATSGMVHGSTAHLLFPEGAEGHNLNIQPVFIPRQPSHTNVGQQQGPGSPAAQNTTDFSVLLRSVAALCSTSGLAMDGSPNNNMPDLTALRSSPQVHSSPSLLYSPMATSAGPSTSSYFINSSTMNMGGDGMMSHEGLAAAAVTDPNLTVLSNGNNLASTLSAAAAAAAMYNDAAGVQTLYSSSDPMAMAAVAAAGATAARQAVQTQSLLQQHAATAAAAAGLGGGLGNFSSLASPLATSSLGKLEDTLSGSLFGAGNITKPVSSSLYIKNLPPDADKLFLYEKFSPYGAILSVKVLNDPQSGQCRGVGFVNFAEHAAAVRSIQALHGTKVGDKLMHVSLQTPRIRASAVQC